MMSLVRALVAITLVLGLGTTPMAYAADHAADTSADDARGVLALLPADSVTSHSLKTPQGTIAYTATAGTLSLHGRDGHLSAKVFYTAYIARDRPANRPLTFAFNGGPGAASAYLHLGLVGPRIVDFGADGHDGSTPTLKDNPQSWLAFTDLVLIDPVGTGWSHAAGKDDKAFWSVKGDAEALAKVIALYVQHNDLIAAPKYLLGESYGGFRAAKVATALKDSQGILVSGVIMISPLIDSHLVFGATDYPLGAALQLPSIAAAELERRKAFSPAALAAAEKFAMGDYLTTLAGPTPSGAAADAFYKRIAGLTGLKVEDIARQRGFVGDIYTKLPETGQVASPYDAAFATPDPYPERSGDNGGDAIVDGFTRAYGGAFSAYARTELGFKCDLTYNLLNEEVNRAWEWDGSRTTANATGDIRDLLGTLPGFRLLIVHGYDDALTPYGTSRYVLDHLPPSLAANRTALKVYRGGHMFYTRPDSRAAAAEDARSFFAGKMPVQ